MGVAREARLACNFKLGLRLEARVGLGLGAWIAAFFT
jgi:hypothetical protein